MPDSKRPGTSTSEPATPLSGRIAPLLMCALAWCALALQLYLLLRQARAEGTGMAHALISFLGYFTVLTNAFIALVGSAGALNPDRAAPPLLYRPGVVGCATTAIILVGLGYHLLLRELWSPQGLQQLADNLLHYIVPFAGALHWLVYPGRQRLTWRAPFWWCLYPLVYFIYLLLRGALLQAYPYPFLDVTVMGYPRVLGNALGLLAAFTALGFLVRGVGRYFPGRAIGHRY